MNVALPTYPLYQITRLEEYLNDILSKSYETKIENSNLKITVLSKNELNDITQMRDNHTYQLGIAFILNPLLEKNNLDHIIDQIADRFLMTVEFHLSQYSTPPTVKYEMTTTNNPHSYLNGFYFSVNNWNY